MGWLMSVLGAALAVAGAASLANGISYIRLDWGATEVTAGTVALAGGLVTAGLGAVLFRLRDVARGIDRLASAPTGPAPAMAPPRNAGPSGAPRDLDETGHREGLPDGPALRATLPPGVASDAGPAPEAPPTMADAPTVVGRYEANGASYVLFSDGTIEVETETGTHRFASMADLRAHIDDQQVG